MPLRQFNYLLPSFLRSTESRDNVSPFPKEAHQSPGWRRIQVVYSRADLGPEEIVEPVDGVLDGHIAGNIRHRLLKRHAEAWALPYGAELLLIDAADLAEVVDVDTEEMLAELNIIPPTLNIGRYVIPEIVDHPNAVVGEVPFDSPLPILSADRRYEAVRPAVPGRPTLHDRASP